MSERSVYLRDQAAKCGWHADQLTDAETQEQLRKLAAEYIERAVKIEREDQAGVSNRAEKKALGWFPKRRSRHLNFPLVSL